jgi:hypothetical protein
MWVAGAITIQKILLTRNKKSNFHACRRRRRKLNARAAPESAEESASESLGTHVKNPLTTGIFA